MRAAKTMGILAAVLTMTACAPPAPRLSPAELQPLRATLAVAAPLDQTISYVHSAATTGVAVIYVHGTPGSASGWTDYVLEPVAGSQSLALDRPGFGDSGPQHAVTSVAVQAAAVAALLPRDGTTAVLVGHSLGGAVVARVAAEHPQQVRALVLLASALDPAQEKINPLQYLGQMWPFSAMLPRAMRNANDELMVYKGELEDLQPLLSQITAPTIIVNGTKDDLVPFANVAYMQAQLRGAPCVKTVVLPGLNHFLPWNSEAVVRRAVQWAVAADCAAS